VVALGISELNLFPVCRLLPPPTAMQALNSEWSNGSFPMSTLPRKTRKTGENPSALGRNNTEVEGNNGAHSIHGTGIFTYIYYKHQPNVGKYTVHGWYGYV